MIKHLRKIILFITIFGLYSLYPLYSEEKPLVEIEANYLAYSYDWDVIYAEEEVKVKVTGIEISCQWLRIDFKNSILSASGKVLAKYQDNEITADLFELNLRSNKGRFLSFGQEIKEVCWPEDNNKNEAISQQLYEDILEITRKKIESSFLYYLTSKVEISPQMEVTGYEVILILEGIPSLQLSKRKLKSSLQVESTGFRFKSIRFANNQGLLTGFGYRFKISRFFSNNTDLHYQERALLRGEYIPERIARINNQAEFRFGDNDNALFSAYYDTAAGWWSRLQYSHRYSSVSSSSIELFYREPTNQRPESWIVINNVFNIGSGGNLNALLKYELQRQYSTALSYSQNLPAGLSFNLSTSYNRRQPGGYLGESQLFDGNFSLNYTNEFVSLQSGYSINRDLLADRTLTQPSLMVQMSPVEFYGDLLSFNISNAFYYSVYHMAGIDEQKSYNNNLAFDISNVPINLFKNNVLSLNLRLEQLMRREGEHTTSGGLLISLQRWISERSYWRLIYSYQTRRPTRNWLIEGMNSQDFTAQIRFQPFAKMLVWFSISGDPELWQMKSSNTNLVYEIGRRWMTELWASYDFQMGSLINLDFILAKDLRRAELRFKWRHLTREFLFEFIPKF